MKTDGNKKIIVAAVAAIVVTAGIGYLSYRIMA